MIAFLLPLAASALGYRGIVIPVEFSDTKFSSLYSGVTVKIESARDYLNDQFTYGPTINFDIAPTVRLSKASAWYGANSSSRKDDRIGELVREACAALKIDWSTYDNDADGYIDNVCFITAGGSEADGAGADHIWPQQGSMADFGGTFQAGSKTVSNFSVCAESSSMAVFCHEFLHSFGLPDMYDTDGTGSGGRTKGLWGKLSIMDSGIMAGADATPPSFSAIELELLGIGRPVRLAKGYHTLRPVGTSKEYLRIDTPNDGEYFLLECRKAEGWDAGIGGEGLVIYHIDKSVNNSWYSDYFSRNLTARERWEHNEINCRPEHPCARVIEATPGTTDISKVFFPQAGHDSFSSDTDPSYHFWNGETAEQCIDNITIKEDGSAVFRVITPLVLYSLQAFQDAAIANGYTDDALTVKECRLTWYPESDKSRLTARSASATVQQDGTFSLLIDNLTPSTTYILDIRAICQDGKIYSNRRSFTTKSLNPKLRPFIYLNSLSRRPDGSFFAGGACPLRIYNPGDVSAIRWYFNDEPVTTGPDGYWHLTESGTLKAELFLKDGSVEILTKKLTVQ